MDELPHDERPPARPGSTADLLHRIDRLEQRQDGIERQVSGLATTVDRVEINQKHAEELAVLRFGSLDSAVKAVDATLERFMGRINAIVSGEVRLPQAVAGEELVRDYQAWRSKVDERLGIIYTPQQRLDIEARLDRHEAFEVQGRLLARLGVLLIGGNILGVALALAAILTR